MYENLHCHTKTSDGDLSYKQVLDVCANNNISIVAFCDHDALPDKKAMQVLENNRSHKTKWIVGTEISSGLPKEINNGPASDFHIVGLFLDPFNKDIIEHCKKAQQFRIQRMEKMVKNLKFLGFDITKDNCLKESGSKTVGRSSIVAVLKQKQKNLKIIEQLRNKMAKQAEYNKIIKEKYDEMMIRGETQYPYVLFLSNNAFIPDIFVDHLYWIDMDKSVDIIRNAGGIAISAHWSFSKHRVNTQMIEKFFQEKRLDGGEIVFGIGIEGEEIKKDRKIMENLIKKYNMIQTGGGDSHTKQDFEFFVQQKELAEKTIGMTQKIIKSKNLNLDFSSL
ncbi:MAG: PHP domain-containing protein [Candidatus Pacebacteria bacterium]|nr:PHP domain-containing protein [Candidatus Paceibacterota bacterium]